MIEQYREGNWDLKLLTKGYTLKQGWGLLVVASPFHEDGIAPLAVTVLTDLLAIANHAETALFMQPDAGGIVFHDSRL